MRKANIDYLKIILSIMVVALHAGIFSEISGFLTFIFANGLLRVAVPVFFIISGFNFLNVMQGKRPLTTWIKRLLTLYAVWMLIYLPYYLPEKALSFQYIAELMGTIIIGYHHLWYVVGVLGAGITLFTVRRRSDVEIVVISAVLFVIGLFIQYLACYATFENPIIANIITAYWLHRNFLFFGFPLFSIGYLIAKNGLDQKCPQFGKVQYLALGISFLFLESAINYLYAPTKGFDMYLSLLFICPVIFLTASSSCKFLQTDMLAKMSTAIYLAHPLLIELIDRVALLGNGTMMFVSATGLSMLISFPLMMMDKKIKVML